MYSDPRLSFFPCQLPNQRTLCGLLKQHDSLNCWSHVLAASITQLEHCVASQQFDRQMLDQLFAVAHQMEHVGPRSEQAEMLRGFVMATLFYEPSTRTRLSFEAAMMRLGGRLISTENASEFSSGAKGESLEGEKYNCFVFLLHSLQFLRLCTVTQWNSCVCVYTICIILFSIVQIPCARSNHMQTLLSCDTPSLALLNVLLNL